MKDMKYATLYCVSENFCDSILLRARFRYPVIFYREKKLLYHFSLRKVPVLYLFYSLCVSKHTMIVKNMLIALEISKEP